MNELYDEDDGTGILSSALIEPRFRIHIMTHTEAKSKLTLFDDYQPSYIILYDADVYLIRRIELYGHGRHLIPPKVYFLLYENSAEQHRYVISNNIFKIIYNPIL
jgi:DNA excision repair protein ERCC-4